MTDFLPQIDSGKCIGCELCVKVCPNAVLAMVDQIAVIANPGACDYTSACQEICPTEAISLIYEIVFPNKHDAVE
jgi:formate hydrogenlyase subunit 6/NADH:ubiquinone oxidoreductase subunit I